MGFSLKAMWNYKCPKCRQGDMFVKPLKISKPLDMNERCEYCNQRYTPEPGFYFGALFLSYIFSGWFFLLPTLLLVFYFGWSVNSAMIVTLVLFLVSYLKILRGARALWLHFVVKHDPELEKQLSQGKTSDG